MKKLRIAFGSDDGKNIVSSHMGEAKYFFIYDLFENGEWKFIEKRENTSPEATMHGDANKLKIAAEIFKDSDIVLARMLSPNFINMRNNTRFQPIVTKFNSIPETMQELGNSFNEIYNLVENRKRGERPKKIPIIGKKSDKR